jgi:hypothetical protein
LTRTFSNVARVTVDTPVAIGRDIASDPAPSAATAARATVVAAAHAVQATIPNASMVVMSWADERQMKQRSPLPSEIDNDNGRRPQSLTIVCHEYLRRNSDDTSYRSPETNAGVNFRRFRSVCA